MDKHGIEKWLSNEGKYVLVHQFQEWLRKAKSLSEKSKENTGDPAVGNGSDKKRKREEEDEEVVKKPKDSASADIKKTPLTQSTNSKLANFAFSKEAEWLMDMMLLN